MQATGKQIYAEYKDLPTREYYNSKNLSTTETKASKWMVSKKKMSDIKINQLDIKVSIIGASERATL